MSKPSNQFKSFLLTGLAALMICGSAYAQSSKLSQPVQAAQAAIMQEKTVSSDKSLVQDKREKEIAKATCETVVRPIQRVKKPAKPTGADWTTMASTYSHDATGQRVDQYAQTVEPQSMERPDFVRSGYRHTRSTLQAGFSADHYHQTESWGQPVRPYGEWRYPNRPFSVPYGQWGPQLPQVVVGGNQFNSNAPWGQGTGHPPMNGGQPGNTTFGGVNGPGTPGWGQGQNGFGANGFPMPGWGQGNGTGPGSGVWPGSGFGQGFGQGFGVGPMNVLPAGQDEYYPQAPIYHPIPDESFRSPFRD